MYTNERRYKGLKRLSFVYTIIYTEDKYRLFFDSGAYIDKHCISKIFLIIALGYCFSLFVQDSYAQKRVPKRKEYWEIEFLD